MANLPVLVTDAACGGVDYSACMLEHSGFFLVSYLLVGAFGIVAAAALAMGLAGPTSRRAFRSHRAKATQGAATLWQPLLVPAAVRKDPALLDSPEGRAYRAVAAAAAGLWFLRLCRIAASLLTAAIVGTILLAVSGDTRDLPWMLAMLAPPTLLFVGFATFPSRSLRSRWSSSIQSARVRDESQIPVVVQAPR